MIFDMIPVRVEEKEILRNLLEKYAYEFSQYDLCDVNALGLFGYGWLDCYWTEADRHAFFIKADGKLAGFVMVNDHFDDRQGLDYSMSEFCILYKYRRQGVGRCAACWLFDRFPGKWQVKCHPKNTASVAFWNKVISEYTKGKFEWIRENPNVVYDDGSLGDIFYFDTADAPHMQRIRPEHRAQVNAFLIGHWFSTDMLIRGRVYDLSEADGFVLFDGSGQEIIGLATYVVEGDECELTSLDSVRPNHGIGGALVEAVAKAAKSAGCRRLRLITTNDNLNAMRFYQKHGFELSGVNLGVIDRERAQKPEIPLLGMDGISLRHEIEFQMEL